MMFQNIRCDDGFAYAGPLFAVIIFLHTDMEVAANDPVNLHAL